MKIAFIFVDPSHLSALRRSWCASITEKLCLIVQLPTNPLQCLQGQHPVCLILGCYLDLPTHLIYPLFLVFRSPLKSPKISKQTTNGGDNHHPTTGAVVCLQHLLLQHLGQLCPTDQVFGHSTSKVMLLES